MRDSVDSDQLIELIRAALALADAQENTLVAALLAECLDTMERPSQRLRSS